MRGIVVALLLVGIAAPAFSSEAPRRRSRVDRLLASTAVPAVDTTTVAETVVPEETPRAVAPRPEPPPVFSTLRREYYTYHHRGASIDDVTMVNTRLSYPTVLIFREPFLEIFFGEPDQFMVDPVPATERGKSWAIAIKPIASHAHSGLVVVTPSGYYRFVLNESDTVPPMMTVEIPMGHESTGRDPLIDNSDRLIRYARGEINIPGGDRRILPQVKLLRSTGLMRVELIGAAGANNMSCIIMSVTNTSSTAELVLRPALFHREDVFGVGIEKERLAPGESSRVFVVTLPKAPGARPAGAVVF